MPSRLTKIEYLNRIQKKFNTKFRLLDLYVNQNTNIRHLIISENRILERTPMNMLYNRNCLFESAIEHKKSIRKSDKQFKKELKEKWKCEIYHGNKRCTPFNDKNAAILRKETINIECLLKALGYKVFSIWEYTYMNDYKAWCKVNIPRIRRFIK